MKKVSRLRRHRSKLIVASALASGLTLKAHAAPIIKTANWEFGISNSWASNSGWSTSPQYPRNGTPTNTEYNAFIGVAGTYTVTLSTTLTVDSLTITNPKATLYQSAGTLTCANTNISAGTYTSSGQLAGGLLSVAPTASYNMQYGASLSGITLGNGTTINANPYYSYIGIYNGLSSLGASTLNITGYDSTIECYGTETFSGVTINFSSYDSISGDGTSNLTLAPTTKVIGDGYLFTTSLTNQGTISAPAASSLYIENNTFTTSGTVSAVNGGTVQILASNWNNSGNITVDGNGSTVSLYGAWTNTGTITGATGGTIDLGGTFNASSIGTLHANGATMIVNGTFDNTNNNFAIPDAGSLTIGGVITGGSVIAPAGQTLQIEGELNNVQVNSDVSVVDYNIGTVDPGTVFTTGDIAVGTYSSLLFTAQQTLDNATVQLGGLLQGDNLTIGSKTAINASGTARIGTAASEPSDPPLTNNGTINSTNSFYYEGLQIDEGTFINNGKINLSNAGNITIEGYHFNNNGTINVGSQSTLAVQSYAFTNSGSINAAAGSAVIVYGSCTTADVMHIYAAGATVTLSTAIDNSNSTFTVDGSNGLITLGDVYGNPGSITGGAVHITNNQTLTMGTGGNISASLTIEAGSTLVGAGTISGPSLINHGTIAAGTGRC